MSRIRDEETGPVNRGEPPPDAVDEGLAAARPEVGAVERRLGLNAVLDAVLGRPAPAVRVGRWTLERQVGAGGMGVVYRARGPEGERVALKLLDRGLAPARFEREAALLGRIEHPGVVRYIDHGTTEEGQPYLVMEWLEGEDLAHRLRREGRLTVEEALRLALQVARATEACHAAGVIHRDLKPANLFLVGGALEEARVVDFGVARVADDEATRLTTTGAVLGTPHYMAPEQLEGRADERTDVYALGACLYECLAGAPPFSGETPAAILQRVLQAPPPSLEERRPGLPAALDALIGRLLAKDPERRPRDMAAVALAVADLLTSDGRGTELSRGERRSDHGAAPPGAEEHGEVALLGRSPEKWRIFGLIEGAFEEGQAVVAAFTGAPGMGRSTLLRAVAEAPRAGRSVLVRCAPGEGGAPFSLLRRLLEPEGGADIFDPAGADPIVAADRLRIAWLDRLDRWRQTPLALFVDDLHLADVSSLRFLALAVEHLRDHAFALVFTEPLGAAPPLPGVETVQIQLGPLGPRSLARLAGAETSDALALCGGNPGELRRLLHTRVGAPGWTRFEALPAELRRVGRACALVGPVAPRSAVAALLGVAPEDPRLDEDLQGLRRDGVLDPEEDGDPRFPSTAAWEAVRATCTEADRRRAAAAMAQWLAPRHRPGERGRHLLELGERAQAARCFLDAARIAAAGEDEAGAQAWLAAAESCGEMEGERSLLKGQLAFWRGRVPEAVEAAERALASFPEGSPPWFEAASLGITASGQRGDQAGMLRVAERARAAAPGPDPDPRTIALCRALTQLATVEGLDTAALAADALATPAHSPSGRAWQARVRAALAATQGFDLAIQAQIEAHREHRLDQDLRSAALIGLYLGSWYVWSGAWERAADAIDDTLRAARRLGASYLDLWSRYARGKLLVEVGDPREALAALERVATEAADSPRIRAGAQLYASLAALRAGDPAAALAAAEAAAAHPGVRRAARAAAGRALLAQGEIQAAEARLEEDHPATLALRVVEWDELIHLARAEVALEARGDRAPLTEAAARIRARAATLADPTRRNDYLTRPHLVARTLALVG